MQTYSYAAGCVNATKTRDGYKVGVWLETLLTQAEEVSNARKRKHGSEWAGQEDV